MTESIQPSKKLSSLQKPEEKKPADLRGLGAAISRLGVAEKTEAQSEVRVTARPEASQADLAQRLQAQRPKSSNLAGPSLRSTWGAATQLAFGRTPESSNGPVSLQAPAESEALVVSAARAESPEPVALDAEAESQETSESEFSRHTQTVHENLDLFDNPDNPEDTDNRVSQEDFAAVAEGEYDQEAVRAELEAEGLSQDEIEARLEEIEAAAAYFNESDTHRHALDAADGDRDGGVSAEGAAEQIARSEAYDAAVERHQEVTEVADPQQAIAILRDFGQLADTAEGEGEVDEEIGRSDLEALINDPATPASLRAAASYLLDEDNQVVFNAIDGAGSDGNANGKITFYNLSEASSRFENWNQERGPVENTLDAAEVLADFGYLADAASGGGSGASDGEISFDDLENLAQSQAVPQHVRESAQFFLDLHEQSPEKLLPFRPDFATYPLNLEHLRAFNQAPQELREVLAAHGSAVGDGYIQIQDGRPVWSDTGEALTAEQYAALNSQWKKQIEDPESIALVEADFSFDLEEVQSHYRDGLDSVSDSLAEQNQAIQAENDHFSRYLAEFGNALSQEQLDELTQQHQQRLNELQQPLEESAAEFVELAEDPLFQESFRNFSDEEKEDFFATVADSVGNTEAGREFAEELLEDLEVLGGNPEADGVSPFADVASELAASGKDVKKFRDAITVLANRQFLNAGTQGSQAYVSVARFLYGAEFAEEVNGALRDLSVAAEQGQDAYEAARQALDSQLNNYKGRGPAGAFDFLAAGALAADALYIAEHGFDSLADPRFALNAAKDVADTVNIVSRVLGAGSGTLRTLSRIGNGFGAIAGAVGLVQGVVDGDAAQAASGGLALLGYGLVAFGVGGPVGPVLLAASVVVGFLPGLLEEDPYFDYADARSAEIGIEHDNLQGFAQFSPEAQAEVRQIAEELGLPPAQVAQMAIRAIGLQNQLPAEGEEGASQVREGLEQFDDPLFILDSLALNIPEGENLDAYRALEEETGLEGEELQSLIGTVAEQSYRQYLEDNPNAALTLREYWIERVAELVPEVLAAAEG